MYTFTEQGITNGKGTWLKGKAHRCQGKEPDIQDRCRRFSEMQTVVLWNERAWVVSMSFNLSYTHTAFRPVSTDLEVGCANKLPLLSCS